MSTVSVVIPSALRKAPDGELWLSRALRSVAAQTVRPCEVIVGLDPGECWINVSSGPDGLLNTIVANGTVRGHQSATNAACSVAKGDFLAFLEDDDLYEVDHLATLLAAAKEHGADFVSASQLQVDPAGRLLVNRAVMESHAAAFHFPTASSWLIRNRLWQRIGGFDVRFRIHHDNAMLGELNRFKPESRRVHIVPENTPPHPWLDNVARHAKVVRWPGLTHYTVRRTVHEGSVLAGCRQDQAKAERSAKEYAALEILYGCVPW